MSLFSIKNIIDSTKATLMLMGYCLRVTIITWVGMFCISYIPFIDRFAEFQ